MHKYIVKLKDGFNYDDELKTYFKKNNIEVEKQLEKLDLIIIKSKNPISINDFNCFEFIEEDKNDFSI